MALGAGDRCGPYEILSALGAGGMGEVYRARDPRLDRLVAIKVLPGSMLGDSERRERFEREARTIAALNHPGIVTIYSVEQDASIPFLTMELVEGRTLAELIPRSGLPLERFLQISVQLCDAVTAAHQKGIVHRDLKSTNIMVTDDGRVKVLDFGLAKLKESPHAAGYLTALPTQQLTGEGRIVGTVAYMSPEQAEGRSVDHRSDIFSLGIVLYEMATGQRPFIGDTNMSVLTSIIRDTPPSVTESRVDMPRELSRIVRRCLEKDPARRIQTTLDLRNELEDLRTELTVSTARAGVQTGAAITSTTAEPPTPWRRSAGITVSLLVILLGTGGAIWWRTHRAEDTPIDTLDRIAVAPFENRTGDRALDSLALLTADALTQGLTQVGPAEMVPAGDTSQASAKTADQVQALAENNGATLAIVGAYYVEGSDLQFQARVMDARRRRLLYAVPPVSGPRGEPARLVEALKQRVTGFVGMYFDPGFNVLLMSHVPTYDAYREYTAAFELFGFDYTGSINHLHPDFMFPELMLATVYGNLGNQEAKRPVLERLVARRDQLTEYERLLVDYSSASGEGNALKSLEYLRRAEKTDRRSFVVNYLIGLITYHLARPQETIESFRDRPLTDRDLRYRAFTWRYNPLTWALHALGRYEEEHLAALDAQRSLPESIPYRGHTARALVALNQLDELRRFVDQTMAQPGASTAGGSFLLDIAYELRAHGRPEEAVQIGNRAAAWYRSRPSDVAAGPASRYALARALDLVGRSDEAQKVVADLVRQAPENIDYRGALGAMAARSGVRQVAARIADELAAFHRPFLYGQPTYWRACIAAALGEKETAVDLLRESFAEGRSYSIDFHRDPNLEALRGYPPYEELVRPQSR